MVPGEQNTIENMKLNEVKVEYGTVRNPTACEEIEHCHGFKSKTF